MFGMLDPTKLTALAAEWDPSMVLAQLSGGAAGGGAMAGMTAPTTPEAGYAGFIGGATPDHMPLAPGEQSFPDMTGQPGATPLSMAQIASLQSMGGGGAKAPVMAAPGAPLANLSRNVQMTSLPGQGQTARTPSLASLIGGR